MFARAEVVSVEVGTLLVAVVQGRVRTLVNIWKRMQRKLIDSFKVIGLPSTVIYTTEHKYGMYMYMPMTAI